ncbi:MAG: hypothetical protein ISS01_03090 [Nanoarchaeota archaeon]|nr:hypothetical protein [Nanoarchaeota archaeon]
MVDETLENKFLRFLRESKELSPEDSNYVLETINQNLKSGEDLDSFYRVLQLQVPLGDALESVIGNVLGGGENANHLIDFLRFSNPFTDETPTNSGIETKVKRPAIVTVVGESQTSFDHPIPVTVDGDYEPGKPLEVKQVNPTRGDPIQLFLDPEEEVQPEIDPIEFTPGMFEPHPGIAEDNAQIDDDIIAAALEEDLPGAYIQTPVTPQTRDFVMDDEPIEPRRSARWPYAVGLLGAAALALFAGKDSLGGLGSSAFDSLIRNPLSGILSSSDTPDQGAYALADTGKPNSDKDINYLTLAAIVNEEIIEAPKVIKEKGYLTFDGNALTLIPTEGSSLFEFAAMINQFSYADSLGSNLDVYTLASMPKDELETMRLGLREQTFTKESLLANLELTKLIIGQNPDLVHNVDLSLEGLKDGTKNVIYVDTPLTVKLVPDSYADDDSNLFVQNRLIDDIEAVAYATTDNVSLEQSLTAFRDLEALVQENPTLVANRNLNPEETRTNLAQEVARQYNANDGLDNIDLSQWAYDKRISLALEWYKTCANPGDRETYMTVNEIVENANLNLAEGEKVITANDIRSSTDFRRSGLGTLAALNAQRSSARQERKAKVYNEFVEAGINDLSSTEAKQFVEEQAEELGYTERTVKQYIKEASQDVPEARLTYDEHVLGGGNRTFLYCGDKSEETIEEIVIEPENSVLEESFEEITSIDRDKIIEEVAEVLEGNSIPEYEAITVPNITNRTFLYVGDKPEEPVVEEPERMVLDNTIEKIILKDLAMTYDPLINDTPLEEFEYPSLSKSLLDYKSVSVTCLDDACEDIDDFEVNLVGGYDGIRQLVALNIAKKFNEQKITGVVNTMAGYSDNVEWTYDMRMSLAVDLVTHANGYNGGSELNEYDPSSHLELNEIVELVNDLREDRKDKPITRRDLNEYLDSQNIQSEELDLSYLM